MMTLNTQVTDDAAKDYPKWIWVVFLLLFGGYMTFGGYHAKVKKVSTGVGAGLAAAISAEAALVNIFQIRDSNRAVTLVALIFFGLGFAFGFFDWDLCRITNFGQITGTYMLAITGGLAFSIRIMLLRSNLLFHGPKLFPLVWVIIVFCGLGGLVYLKVLKFFKFEKLEQITLDIVMGGYFAPFWTQFIIGASLVVTPIAAVIQYKVYGESWEPRKPDADDGIDLVSCEADNGNSLKAHYASSHNELQSDEQPDEIQWSRSQQSRQSRQSQPVVSATTKLQTEAWWRSSSSRSERAR